MTVNDDVAKLVYDHALSLAQDDAVQPDEAIVELLALAHGDPQTIRSIRDLLERELAEGGHVGDASAIRAFGLLTAAAERETIDVRDATPTSARRPPGDRH